MYDQQKIDEFLERAEAIAKSSDTDAAFKAITDEIDQCDERYLNEYITSLNTIRYEKVLDWIEANAHRIKNVNLNWGHLAASSYFSWARAEKWLSMGRPLSLIALDALSFCTTRGERLNQSLWMRQIQPTLSSSPTPDIIAKRLQQYLSLDNVPRTKSTVEVIINNIFEIDK